MAARPRDKLPLALALLQNGRLEEAEAIYKAVLRDEPTHFDALHYLGLIALQTGRAERGVQLIGKAVARRPNVAQAHSNMGIGLADLGRYAEALNSYDKAIALNPAFPEAYDNRGNALRELGRLEEAIASYDKAIALQPNDPGVHTNRGNALLDLRRYKEALASHDRALELQPDFLEALCNRGTVLQNLGQFEEALASFDKVIAREQRYPEALNGRGNTLRNLHRTAEALADFNQAIALRPDYAEALNNHGNALQDLQQYEDALVSYDRAIALKPGYAEAHYNRANALLATYDKALALCPDDPGGHTNRGNALRDLGQHEEALASYDRALALQPDSLEALRGRGTALHGLQRFEEALSGFDKAIVLRPDHAEAFYRRGNALRDLRRPEEALSSFDQAIILRPDYAEAHHDRGNALQDLQQYEAALVSYGRAIALKPDSAEAYHNRANILSMMSRYDEALIDHDKTIALKPREASAHFYRGTVLQLTKRHKEAIASCANAIALGMKTGLLFGQFLSFKRTICDWTSDKYIFDTLIELIEAKEFTLPFTLVGFSDSSALQKKSTELYIQSQHPASNALPPLTRHSEYPKIRIGYFSADFWDHAMMRVMIDMFVCHDRSKFELTAFSFGPDRNDEMRQRVVGAFDRFIDVRTILDQDVALLARRLEIDIAIDLMGFTEHSRTTIFSFRAAPIQVNYLGYPGTMGADYIDYLIADRILIPPANRHNFTEKIVYMPDSYQPTERNRTISDRLFTRAEQGLPETGFVFCCFSNTYKITPRIFECWMQILKNVEGSVLWLLADNADTATNLRQEALARGVAAERLIFAKRLSFADYLARNRLADLFLDTLPYNAHATGSDALWSGLPVLTCLGDTFASRVGGSLLTAIDLPELITTTLEAYQARAVELATQPDLLKGIRAKLAANRLTTPLFDPERFTRNLEAAFTTMVARHQAGLPPDHLVYPFTSNQEAD